MTERGIDNNAETAVSYLSLYGLTHEPFGAEMPPASFYPGATREQRLNLLLSLVPLGEILLITGVTGVGKSALLTQFIARGKESWRICRLDATAGLDSNSLVQHLAQSFSPEALAQTDRAEQERLLIAQLQGLRKSAQQPILLIDNAHNISESGFRALSKFIVEGSEEEKLLGIVLFSEPAIEEKLDNPALQLLRSQIKHSFELPLLSEEEVAGYLAQRMQAAGFQGESPFTEAVNKAIFGASKGLPRKINELAYAVLQNKRYSESQDPAADSATSATSPAQIKASGFSLTRYWPFAVAALLASVLLFQDEINALFNPPSEKLPISQQPTAGAIEHRPDLLPASESESQSSDASELKPKAMSEIREDEQPADVISSSAPPVKEALTAASGSDTDKIQMSDEAVNLQADGEITVDASLPVAALEPKPEPESEPTPELKLQPSPPEVATTPLLQTPAVEVAEPVVLEGGAEWVRAQSAGAYTLQLVAQEKIEKREKFIARFELGGSVERFSTRKKGQRWYVAVSGVYDSRSAALEAGGQLPQGVVPWVRSFGSIQKELWQAAPDGGVKPVARVPAERRDKTEATAQERWVLGRPEGHFTLQLVAFEDEQKTRDFIRGQALGEGARQVRLINKGKIWHVAIYGDAADRAAALDLADNISDNKGIGSPWVRSYGSLQQSMKGLLQ